MFSVYFVTVGGGEKPPGDQVFSVFRTAVQSGKLGDFSVDPLSIVGIEPVIPSTTKPPKSRTTPRPDGTWRDD